MKSKIVLTLLIPSYLIASQDDLALLASNLSALSMAAEQAEKGAQQEAEKKEKALDELKEAKAAVAAYEKAQGTEKQAALIKVQETINKLSDKRTLLPQADQQWLDNAQKTYTKMLQADARLHLINFNHETIRHLFLTREFSTAAPPQVPYVVKADNPQITLTQLLVVWQFLPMKTFFYNKDSEEVLLSLVSPRKEGGGAYTKKGAQDLLTLLQETNKKFKEKHKNIAPDNHELGGGNVSCGYHAIKNILILNDALYAQEERQAHHILALTNLSLTDYLFGTAAQRNLIAKENKPGVWRQYIIAHPTISYDVTLEDGSEVELQGDTYDLKERGTGNWLLDDGMSFLWKHNFTNLKPVAQQLYLYKPFITMRVVTTQGAQILGQRPDIKQAYELARLQFLKSTTAQPQAFVIHEGMFNHWFSLVLIKINNTIQAFIMDSKNVPRYDHPAVCQIIKDFTESAVPPFVTQESKTEVKSEAEADKIINAYNESIKARAKEKKSAKEKRALIRQMINQAPSDYLAIAQSKVPYMSQDELKKALIDDLVRSV